jgi:hypothetical protein
MKYTASKAITPRRSKAVNKLIKLGLIPAECTRFELVLDARDVIRARCEFFVNEEQMQQIADAFKANPGEAARIIKTGLVGLGPTIGAEPNVQFMPAIEI